MLGGVRGRGLVAPSYSISDAWQQKEASLPGPFSSQQGRPSRLVNAVTAFIFKSNHQIVDEAKWPTGVFRK
jgi:hypothetical protein